MQGGYLLITFGTQFFMLVGYLFYFVFRKYPKPEDQVPLMTCMTGLVGILTMGLLMVVVIVIPRMIAAEATLAIGLVIADISGLYLLIDEIRRKTRKMEEDSQPE